MTIETIRGEQAAIRKATDHLKREIDETAATQAEIEALITEAEIRVGVRN